MESKSQQCFISLLINILAGNGHCGTVPPGKTNCGSPWSPERILQSVTVVTPGLEITTCYSHAKQPLTHQLMQTLRCGTTFLHDRATTKSFSDHCYTRSKQSETPRHRGRTSLGFPQSAICTWRGWWCPGKDSRPQRRNHQAKTPSCARHSLP